MVNRDNNPIESYIASVQLAWDQYKKLYDAYSSIIIDFLGISVSWFTCKYTTLTVVLEFLVFLYEYEYLF